VFVSPLERSTNTAQTPKRLLANIEMGDEIPELLSVIPNGK